MFDVRCDDVNFIFESYPVVLMKGVFKIRITPTRILMSGFLGKQNAY